MKIDYSNWNNNKLIKLAEQCDKDGVKGLNKEEVFDFIKTAIDNNIDKEEVFQTMGLSIQKTITTTKHPDFEKAADYYNNNMDYNERSNITNQAYSNLETRLYQMEKAIDNAFIECDAYKDIVIVPRWHYRNYDKLLNFDIEEVRNITSKDMNALQELKEKIEYIIEDANGESTHTVPEKTDFDIEALAKKHLGMSYEEFANLYKEEIEFCKTVTYADLTSMNEKQRMVYAKTKAYAAEMLQTTINEAHTVNWDAGERKLDETLKAGDDMFILSDFETDGINDEKLNEFKSGIMYKAFEDALINKYHELFPSGIEDINADKKEQKPKKQIVNGVVLIFNPDGSVYDTSGKRIK